MRYTLFLFVLLQGCQSGPYPVSSPYFDIPSGSQLVLKTGLTIPANSARIYLQHGKVITPQQKDQYSPHCWFLSWKVSTEPQHIEPDTFIIRNSQQVEDYVLSGTKLYASAARSGHHPSGSDIPLMEYSTQMSLQSTRQPFIKQLICNHWVDASTDTDHLTVREIQGALGNIAELKLNTRQ